MGTLDALNSREPSKENGFTWLNTRYAELRDPTFLPHLGGRDLQMAHQLLFLLTGTATAYDIKLPCLPSRWWEGKRNARSEFRYRYTPWEPTGPKGHF